LASPAGLAGFRPAPQFRPLPLAFEPNVGQTHSSVRFLGRGRDYTVFLTAREAVLKLPAGKGRWAAVRLQWVGANPDPISAGIEPLASRVNYFVGNDPAAWRTNVPSYGRVVYRGVYPGVDLVFRSTENRLEYDFDLAAGVDPGLIRFSVDGVRRIRLDPQGDLLLEVGGRILRQPKPVVYQDAGGVRKMLDGRYVILGSRLVGFQVNGLDRSKPLTIDPVLVYSSYLGGAGEDWAAGIAVDSQGKAYVAGTTASATFPTTTGAYRSPQTGGADAFVAKWNADGSALEYVAYLGGRQDDVAQRVAIDPAGNAHVVGATKSQDFPMSMDGFQRTYGGGDRDAFVAKLNPAGNLLAYATYLGGTGDEAARDIALDFEGKIYVTGFTNSRNFPISQGVQQPVIAGGYDVFVTKVDPFRKTVLDYSTFLGGTGDEAGNAIKVDAAGLAHVAGITYSDNFPTTSGVFQPRRSGHDDSFLAKLNAGGNRLVFSTYLGGNCEEETLALALDKDGNAYLTGYVQTKNFPVTAGAFQPMHGGGDDDAFIAKINPTGSQLLYATYLGGAGDDCGYDISLDDVGNIYVLGSTTSTNFPLTPAAYQTTRGGDGDVFLVKMHPGGAKLGYATLLGGAGLDEGEALALDAAGDVYAAGYTGSADFPVTSRAFQRALGGSWDAFVAKLRLATITTVSAASFRKGAASAPDSIVAGYGPEMSPVTQSAPAGQPLPMSLAGVSVTVADSRGAPRDAPLFFVSAGQINYLLPAGTASGLATVTVKNGAQVVNYGLLDVEPVAPGLFTANFNGQGAPAAIVKQFRGGQLQVWMYAFQCAPGGGTCTPAPISMGSSSDQIFLELYGTGIRGASSLSAVTAMIGGEDAVVEYVGAVAGFFGLDQVNVRVPRSLAGRGLVDLVLTVDGKQSNTVQLDLL
ncbi:MAG TPA: SBBP repeat-containing protein, partial [Bryobacteraceae bacterium]|nr:SBBP repeat-containing protein [Bryobacteraceae bacterium]